ncbi:MAG: hypothetical protein ACYDBB_23600 [Armatimonadota bacterium]
MVARAAEITLTVTKHYLAHGIGPLLGWYGPEMSEHIANNYCMFVETGLRLAAY